MNFLLEALIKKLEGEIEMAKANIKVYEKNPAGIGEHPDIIEAMRGELSKLSAAEEDLQTLNKQYVQNVLDQIHRLQQ